MEIKRIFSAEEVEEKSPIKKIQPVSNSSLREDYDILLSEIDWDKYFPGKYVSKYA